MVLSSYELLGAAVEYSISMISLVALFARRRGLVRFSQPLSGYRTTDIHQMDQHQDSLVEMSNATKCMLDLRQSQEQEV